MPRRPPQPRDDLDDLGEVAEPDAAWPEEGEEPSPTPLDAAIDEEADESPWPDEVGEARDELQDWSEPADEEPVVGLTEEGAGEEPPEAVEGEAPGEADWLLLEGIDLVPRGLRIVGHEERVDLPVLGLLDVVALLDTGAEASTLCGPGLAEEAVRTVLRLGRADRMVTLHTQPGALLSLRLGRDVLAGWLLVDANQRFLFRR